MGNSLYQSPENGEIKVDLYSLSYPFFSPLVALYLSYHLFPFRLLYDIHFSSCKLYFVLRLAGLIL